MPGPGSSGPCILQTRQQVAERRARPAVAETAAWLRAWHREDARERGGRRMTEGLRMLVYPEGEYPPQSRRDKGTDGSLHVGNLQLLLFPSRNTLTCLGTFWSSASKTDWTPTLVFCDCAEKDSFCSHSLTMHQARLQLEMQFLALEQRGQVLRHRLWKASAPSSQGRGSSRGQVCRTGRRQSPPSAEVMAGQKSKIKRWGEGQPCTQSTRQASTAHRLGSCHLWQIRRCSGRQPIS